MTIMRMLAVREKRRKGRDPTMGCLRLLNAGVCGLDWHLNGKPVRCRYCRELEKQNRK